MKERFESGSPEPENEEKESRERQEGSIEVSKIADFMRKEMDNCIKRLEQIKNGDFATSHLDPYQKKERILKEVAYANGQSNFILGNMLEMLKDATGEEFKELKEELKRQHWERVQKLKGEIEQSLIRR